MGYPTNELWGNVSPVCPYCRARNEYEGSYCDTETERECESCDKKFRINVRVETRFDSVGCCKANNEMPHTLNLKLKFDDGGRQYSCSKCQNEYYDWQLAGGKYPRLTEDEYTIVRDHYAWEQTI